MRSTRTLARRRRCAHHGTPSTHTPIARTGGQGSAAGADRGRGGQPSARARDDGHRVAAFGAGDQADPRARHGRAKHHGDSGRECGPPARVRGVQHPRGERGHRGDGERGEFGAVPPQPPGEDHDDQVGQRVAGVDDDHGL